MRPTMGCNGRLVLTRLVRKSPPRSRPSADYPFTSCIPEKPTWSTKTLSEGPPPELVTPAELHHLLRLSALPLPKTPEEEGSLIRNLQLQLRFVQRIQACDTTDVEPLTRIRDETDAAIFESTIGTEELAEALDAEVRVGHYKRPRRVRDASVDTRGAEDWDPLSTASHTAGRYFVVKGGNDNAQ